MFSDLQKLWFTVGARSTILLVLTMMATYCTVRIVYKVDLETILWTLATEALLFITLVPAHFYGIKVGLRHKRKYRRLVDADDGRLAQLKYGLCVVGILWISMFFVHACSFFLYLKKNRNDKSLTTFLGAFAVVILVMSAAASSFFAYGIWCSYRIIILNTIPVRRLVGGIQMTSIRPAGAEAAQT